MNRQRCEVLIIGAGPAGLAAAEAASACGCQVIVLDDNPHPGGQIWRNGPQVKLPAEAQRLQATLLAQPAVTLINGAKVIAPLSASELLYETASHAGRIAYQRLILCCGARERLLPFPGWTLAGVTGAGALQALIKSGQRLEGERVVIAGSGPLLLAVAKSVREAGGEVLMVAEQASLMALGRLMSKLWRWPGKLRQAATLSESRYRLNSRVLAASGEGQVQQVTVQQGKRQRTLACDRLACGFGLLANTELAVVLGCELEQHAIRVDLLQQTSCAQIFAAGECCGVGGSELALVEGRIAGLAAAGQVTQAQTLFPERQYWRRFAHAVSQTFVLSQELKTVAPETLLCRCEDVTFGEVAGSVNWQQAKLASRCGMGACQGKVCGAAAREILGWPLAPPRIPLSPARLETLRLMDETDEVIVPEN